MYNLRRHTLFSNRPIRTQEYGIESLAYLAPKIWALVSNEMKGVCNFRDFSKQNKILENSQLPLQAL